MNPNNNGSLKVYNTLTGQKEEFIPLEPKKVKIYVCGVTPYNHPHIGNARPFITWDVIHRYLEYIGYDVEHIQNFTDIDDKIINTAKSENVTWDVIANRYIDEYFDVMDKLNVRRADIYPRVSEHIEDIIEMISTLIEKGFAYQSETNSDVFYSVESFDDYGKLSKRSLDDLQAGARIDIDENKKHPMDFALWKSAKPDEPAWDSPWGPGRPGWHIECSVMSKRFLGDSFDFHGGGSDLIFPHHENEIAQSEAATGKKPFVKYWLHNGFITLNAEKMSKSTGNFFQVKTVLETFTPETLRFFVLSSHYRSPLDFSDERLDEASKGLDRLKTAYKNVLHLQDNASSSSNIGDAQDLLTAVETIEKEFLEAMDDDFNTSLAIGYLFTLAKEINIYHQKYIQNNIELNLDVLNRVVNFLEVATKILGVMDDPLALEECNLRDEEACDLTQQLIELIIKLRQDAREQKNWAVADEIRDKLSDIGIVLEDSASGVSWKMK
ncbi:cysteine--tRNA ligase [Selenomonadales bacterium OttesenSCG-928-I06]|nr:cysteine--tRNA ligase [Selenomonadales bacterium OttesenSCG-928-I06]